MTPEQELLTESSHFNKGTRTLTIVVPEKTRFLVVNFISGTIDTAESGVTGLVLSMISNILGVPVDVMKGRKRDAHIVGARQLYCWFAKKYTNCGLKTIGREIRRDHATALYSIKIVNDMIETRNQDYMTRFEHVRKNFEKNWTKELTEV